MREKSKGFVWRSNRKILACRCRQQQFLTAMMMMMMTRNNVSSSAALARNTSPPSIPPNPREDGRDEQNGEPNNGEGKEEE